MNSPSYFEIQAADLQKVISFYTAVFWWTFTRDTNIPIEYYRVQTEWMMGGLLKREVPWTPELKWTTNAFMCSMQVENFDITAQKILENSGMVALSKFPVPGKCWQGYFLDPDKNVFGIYQVDENAK